MEIQSTYFYKKNKENRRMLRQQLFSYPLNDFNSLLGIIEKDKIEKLRLQFVLFQLKTHHDHKTI